MRDIPVGEELVSYELQDLGDGWSRIIFTDDKGREDSYRIKSETLEQMGLAILELMLSREEET
jgi:hypothetical protein